MHIFQKELGGKGGEENLVPMMRYTKSNQIFKVSNLYIINICFEFWTSYPFLILSDFMDTNIEQKLSLTLWPTGGKCRPDHTFLANLCGKPSDTLGARFIANNLLNIKFKGIVMQCTVKSGIFAAFFDVFLIFLKNEHDKPIGTPNRGL